MWDKNFKGRYILIEPTDFCNCDCVMCTRAMLGVENPHKSPKGFMRLETFKKIIDGIECGDEPIAIKIFWVGESLLHPQFKEMVEYAVSKIRGTRAYLDLHTNATLLTNELVEFLLSQGPALPRITFSLDAVTPETHKKIRRGGSFENAINGIKALVRERERRHLLFPRFVFQFIIMEQNWHEAKPFVDYWCSFLEREVKITLADAWHLLSNERRIEILKEKGVYEEYIKYGT